MAHHPAMTENTQEHAAAGGIPVQALAVLKKRILVIPKHVTAF